MDKEEKAVEFKEKDKTDFNRMLELEEEEKAKSEKLPIDKLVDIATENKLFDENLTHEQKFKKFIEGIRLNDIVYDCMQSSLNEYCKAYNKTNPEDNLGLKLHLRTIRNKVNVVWSVDLVLEMRRAGLYTILLKKNVEFQHVRQVRDEITWKYALYGEMFNAFVAISIHHLILTHDINTGRIKPTVPA